jgi:hypothetical protein
MAIDLQQLEQRLKDLSCPVCKISNEFSIPRDPRITDGDYKAFCQGCRYSMPVHTDMQAYLRNQPDVAVSLKAMRCPACMNPGATLDFWVQPSVRNAVYFLTCLSCKGMFTEKSSLEAFE